MQKDKDIKCYLCGCEATQKDDPHNPRDKIVECKGDCVNRDTYKVTDEAFRYKLDWKRKDPMNDEDRFKLSQHVFKQQVVPITIEIIEKVTGKRSVGYL
jgi:hypothetical protein